MPDHSEERVAGEEESLMKIRNFVLAVIAFAVLVGSVVPANAAGHHHRHHHHHKG
jgi:hypothetical protein